MGERVSTTFDTSINAYIVRMPEYITLEVLNLWKKEFLLSLDERKSEKSALLLDTNRHQFESIECLKLLKDLLSNESRIKHCISRFAGVGPKQYREPEVISSREVYFSRFEEAYLWLKQKTK